MSYDDEYHLPDDENPSLEEMRANLYEIIGFANGNPLDPDIRMLFWDLMYNDELSYGARRDTYEYLSQRLWTDYGIDFEGAWDWEAFREWYDTVA